MSDPVRESCRYAVLGLGNRLERDEALGALMIERLQTDPAALERVPDPACVDLIDGGTVGLGLLPYLMHLDGLVVVDVIDAKRKPGTLIDLDGATLGRHDTAMSVHDLGARELLGALIVLEAMPRRVRVVGIQPEAIELGLELTPVVEASFPALHAAIVAHLASWQREDGTEAGQAGG